MPGFAAVIPVDGDRAEADEVCGARPGGGQTPIHQYSVEPLFFVDGHMQFSYTRNRVGESRARVTNRERTAPPTILRSAPLGAHSRRSREPKYDGLPHRQM